MSNSASEEPLEQPECTNTHLLQIQLDARDVKYATLKAEFLALQEQFNEVAESRDLLIAQNTELTISSQRQRALSQLSAVHVPVPVPLPITNSNPQADSLTLPVARKRVRDEVSPDIITDQAYLESLLSNKQTQQGFSTWNTVPLAVPYRPEKVLASLRNLSTNVMLARTHILRKPSFFDLATFVKVDTKGLSEFKLIFEQDKVQSIQPKSGGTAAAAIAGVRLPLDLKQIIAIAAEKHKGQISSLGATCPGLHKQMKECDILAERAGRLGWETVVVIHVHRDQAVNGLSLFITSTLPHAKQVFFFNYAWQPIVQTVEQLVETCESRDLFG